MAKNEKSSKEMAALAGKVLAQKTSSTVAKRLAGSVLTQAADKKKEKVKKDKKAEGKKDSKRKDGKKKAKKK
jgi:hypothetical protein